MSSNNIIDLTNLDFDDLKSSLKAYLKGQDSFKDYNFDGSNLSVLLDILTYNTYINAFNINMALSEAFLDSAQLRDSIVGHAKELNYLPRSFRSSTATLGLTVVGDANVASITVPSGKTFTGQVGQNNFSFQTNETIVITGNAGVFTANIDVYEGATATDTFFVDTSKQRQRFEVTNPNIDTDSLVVLTIEGKGSETVSYSLASSLIGLTAESNVYFLQGSNDGKYEIYFGDDTIGRAPTDGSVVVATYRGCSGELPNGCQIFNSDGTIDGYSNVTVNCVSAASGGSISESAESIKFYAPLSLVTQDRAITDTDYETLLRQKFPEITAVAAFGGEESDPPVYGVVFIAAQVLGLDKLPEDKIAEFTDFIKGRCSLGITPEFIEPDYTYLSVNTTVKYDLSVTSLTTKEIVSIVLTTIQNFNTTELDAFKVRFKYSKFCAALDESHASIISNDTTVKLMKKLVPDLLGVKTRATVDFAVPLFVADVIETRSVYPDDSAKTIKTNTFTYKNTTVMLEDDGAGNIWMVAPKEDGHHTMFIVGSVNYDNGLIQLTKIQVDSFSGDSIRFYAVPAEKDVAVTNHVLLEIPDDEIFINGQPAR